ncbi:hypothetical protein [Vagococcus acidifermentans]|nr:hypothetical protein [Vagococcus acidifermentans]
MMKTRLKKKLFTDVVHLCPPGEPYKYLCVNNNKVRRKALERVKAIQFERIELDYTRKQVWNLRKS